MIITIDGPTASGKSTIARRVAQKLHIPYLSTGLLYRAIAYLLVHKRGYTIEQLKAPRDEDIAWSVHPKHLVYLYDEHEKERVFFDDQDITPYLKTKEIDNYSSISSAYLPVRKALIRMQRIFGKEHGAVVEGRDVGSVVFPHAKYKFYLTADLLVRSARWQRDQKKRNRIFTIDEARQAVVERDERDKKRKISPLIVPEGALTIDTTNISADQASDTIVSCIKRS